MSARDQRVDAVGRALNHHEMAGAVTFWGPPSPGRPKWRVRVMGLETREYTLAEAEALCFGLAAGERRWKDSREEAR